MKMSSSSDKTGTITASMLFSLAAELFRTHSLIFHGFSEKLGAVN